jgi:hypothetical protein
MGGSAGGLRHFGKGLKVRNGELCYLVDVGIQIVDHRSLLIVPPLQSDVPFAFAVERHEEAQPVVVWKEDVTEEYPVFTRPVRLAIVVFEVPNHLEAQTGN